MGSLYWEEKTEKKVLEVRGMVLYKKEEMSKRREQQTRERGKKGEEREKRSQWEEDVA